MKIMDVKEDLLFLLINGFMRISLLTNPALLTELEDTLMDLNVPILLFVKIALVMEVIAMFLILTIFIKLKNTVMFKEKRL
jgi:hypothetical protein